MPFEVAHLLARLAWHEGWKASLARAQKARADKPPIYENMDKALEHHKKKAKEHREAWSNLAIKWAEKPRGNRDGAEVVGFMQKLTKASAEHAASMRVYSVAGLKKEAYTKFMEKQKRDQDEHWQSFSKELAALKEVEGVVTSLLINRAADLVWRAAWHCANAVGSKIDEVEENEDEDEEDDFDDDEDDDENDEDNDEDSEDEEARFGDEYLGSSGDDIQDYLHMMDSLTECFFREAPRRGVHGVRLDLTSLSSSDAEADLQEIAAVPGMFGQPGLNAVRLVLPDLSSAKDPLGEAARASLAKAKALELRVLLELPAIPGKKHETWLKALAAAASVAKCVDGVSLPLVDQLANATGLIGALRAGGLDQGCCQVFLPLPAAGVEDDEGEWTPSFAALIRVDPDTAAYGITFQDGNTTFEAPAAFPDDEPFADHQSLLDAASHIGEIIEYADLCSSVSLKLPAFEKSKSSKAKADTAEMPSKDWLLEYSQRLIGSLQELSSGVFWESWRGIEGDETGLTSLKKCIENAYVNLGSDVQIMQPTGGTHKYSLVYLHGFTCDGYCYMADPEYFYRPKAKKAKKAKKSDDGKKKAKKSDDGEDEDMPEYEPIPGLKVLLPSAPCRPITAHNSEEELAWHDYLTDNDGEAEDELPKEELEEQTRRIHAILEEEIAKVGARNVFLGGASQGCGMAIHAGLTFPGELGGLIGTMGHVLTSTPITPEWVSQKVPVYCYIGMADTTMPWDKWVQPTWQRLIDAGADVHVFKEDGADHGDSEDKWTRNFLAEVLRPASVKVSSAKKKSGKK
jgi:predicted esterase